MATKNDSIAIDTHNRMSIPELEEILKTNCQLIIDNPGLAATIFAWRRQELDCPAGGSEARHRLRRCPLGGNGVCGHPWTSFGRQGQGRDEVERS